MASGRRQQAGTDVRDLTAAKERERMERAASRKRERHERKEARRAVLEKDGSYRMVKWISDTMDKYFLDPIIGFLAPGLGDVFASVMTLPFIYVALVKIKSIPLTLAVIYNMLTDALVGSIPFFLGDIIDVFNRSYKKNYALIVGFVEDDKEVVREVNRKALRTAIMIVIVCFIIYWLVSLAVSLTTSAWEYVSSLFA